MARKRALDNEGKPFRRNKKQKQKTVADGSNEDVLLADVRQLLQDGPILDEQAGRQVWPERFSELSLDITQLSSTGDGLAVKDGQVYAVPFTAPGDTVLARIGMQFKDDSYTMADFIKVEKPSPHRTATPKCPYFSRCSGCQFQHLPYAYQLKHKQKVVEKAYQTFSNLPASSVPQVGETVASPLEYGYRTKLTPHFDGPAGGRRDRRQGNKVTWDEVPPIGFMEKGRRKTLDIEDCPIGTDAVRGGMKRERIRVAEQIEQYQRGATILLRESTERTNGTQSKETLDGDAAAQRQDDTILHKTCITDHNATSTEYVDDFRFDNPAGSFFQNNNSILPRVTQYIRDHILAPSTPAETAHPPKPKIKNLIDAYCGSGFFAVTLSSLFTKSIGIDVSAQSITYAAANAKLNNLPPSSTNFIAADANQLFESVDKVSFPPAETAVVIDPPRKGCDENFIRQLMRFGPERICYVSCNVHTQARDVGWLVRDGEDEEGLPRPGMYEIESLRGFDFFPQTGHVESVAILRKR